MSVDARSLMCRNCIFADVHEKSVGEVAETTFTCEVLLPAKQKSWQFGKLHVITVVEIKKNWLRKNRKEEMSNFEKRQNCWMQEGNMAKVKVNCTLVQALRLCTGRTADRGSRVIALLSHDYGARRGWKVSVTLRSLFTPGKTRKLLYMRLGGPQGRSGRAENLDPTGIRSPDRPARSQSLCRLNYPAHKKGIWLYIFIV